VIQTLSLTQTISLIAVGILIVHAVWCLLCKRVSDGVLGKVLYLLVTLAAFAYISRPSPFAQMLLNVSFASIAVRHWWMKTYWSNVKRRIMAYVNPNGKTR
jgi:hypothetical protein